MRGFAATLCTQHGSLALPAETRSYHAIPTTRRPVFLLKHQLGSLSEPRDRPTARLPAHMDSLLLGRPLMPANSPSASRGLSNTSRCGRRVWRVASQAARARSPAPRRAPVGSRPTDGGSSNGAAAAGPSAYRTFYKYCFGQPAEAARELSASPAPAAGAPARPRTATAAGAAAAVPMGAVSSWREQQGHVRVSVLGGWTGAAVVPGRVLLPPGAAALCDGKCSHPKSPAPSTSRHTHPHHTGACHTTQPPATPHFDLQSPTGVAEHQQFMESL